MDKQSLIDEYRTLSEQIRTIENRHEEIRDLLWEIDKAETRAEETLSKFAV